MIALAFALKRYVSGANAVASLEFDNNAETFLVRFRYGHPEVRDYLLSVQRQESQ